MLFRSAADVPMPEGDARKAAAAAIKSSDGNTLAHASVLEGHGFAASTARAVSAGIFLLAQSKTPYKTFASIAEAAAWLASFLDHGELEARLLAQCAHDFRDRHLGRSKRPSAFPK